MTNGLVIANIADRNLTKHDAIAPIIYSWRINSERELNMRFGNSIDTAVYHERLLSLLDRTGREMSQNLIPSIKKKEELCGGCHEIEPTICRSCFFMQEKFSQGSLPTYRLRC